MSFPYAPIRQFEGKEPFLDKKGRLPKEQAQFLLERSHMRGHYLRACLDSCRWGAPTSVMWEMTPRDLIHFIQNWMNQNNGDCQELLHERKREDLYESFELPHISHTTCPSKHSHDKTIEDIEGKLRCAHKTERRLRPSFLRQLNHGDEISYWEDKPTNPIPEDAWDEEGGLSEDWLEKWDEYQTQLARFGDEKPTELINDFCYIVLSDEKLVLPLETILRRLNIAPETRTVYCPDSYKGCTPERLKQIPEKDRWKYETAVCLGHLKKINHFL